MLFRLLVFDGRGECSSVYFFLFISQISAEPLTFQSCGDSSPFSEQVDLALNIKFAVLYIGKYKGKALGCAKVSLLFV